MAPLCPNYLVPGRAVITNWGWRENGADRYARRNKGVDALDKYEEAHSAFRTGSVLTDSNERLLLYLSGLSNQNNINPGTQHRDIIRGLTINNILLQRHIDKLQEHITDLEKEFSNNYGSFCAHSCIPHRDRLSNMVRIQGRQ